MSTRGYVVRGFDTERPGDDHPSVWAVDGGRQTTDVFEFADTFPDLGLAVEAWRRMHDFPVGDITICAVAEDGTETPLPSWEEALNAVGILREAVEQALAHHRETKGMTVNPPELHGCPVGALHFLRRTLGRTS